MVAATGRGYRTRVNPFTRRSFLASLGASVVVWGPGCGRREVPTTYDVVVVGSGFAGLLLALRTATAGLSTLVLEAGGSFAQGGALNPSVSNAGGLEYPIASTRVLALGGTSNHWTGVVGRLSERDMQTQSLFGLDVDWPIRYADLDPWYCEAEQALRVVGRAPVSGEPGRECAYPLQESGYAGPDLPGPTGSLRFAAPAKSLRRPGPVRLTEEELPAFDKLEHGTLLSQHAVTGLVVENGRAVGVAAVDGQGARHRFAARAVVLAAGVLETPRLLLHAGLGGDHVGRHFNAHPTWGWKWEAEAAPQGWTGRSHRTIDLDQHLRSLGLSAAHLQLDTKPAMRWVMQPELEPHRDNRVTLGAQTDAHGVPLLALHFDRTERDARTLEAARALLTRHRGALGVPEDARVVEGWRAHPAGTCRMSASAADGVVDAHNQVHGTPGLYVSGASVFPTSGTANPTLTVVALTLRLAAHLKATLVAR